MQSPLTSPSYYQRHSQPDHISSDYDRMVDTNEAGRLSWAAVEPLPSRTKSFFLVFMAALQSVLTSGMVFGWAPLQLMLEEEGIYADQCKDGVAPCPEQGIKLQQMYTVATSAFCFCVWPTGIILDRFGPRVCCMMGALFFGAGCGIMAISSPEMDYFMTGLVLIAIGGLPVVLAMMHLSNLLPEYAGTVITLFNVCIDISSLNFKLIYVIFSMGFTRKDLFLGYCAVPIFIFVTAPLLWPMKTYEARTQASAATGDTTQEPHKASSLEGLSFLKQVTSKHFILCALFTAFQLLHVNFYIGTVDDQVREKVSNGMGNSTSSALLAMHTSANVDMQPPLKDSRLYSLGYAYLDDDDASKASELIARMCSAFAWILPLGGVVMTYPVGWMLDNLRMWHCIFALSFAGLLHSTTTLIDGTMVLYGSFLLFAYFRAALFGTMATEVAFTFGHENFGKLWGVLYLCAGCMNFGIAEIAQLAKELGTFWHINVAFLSIGAFLLAYPTWLYWADWKDREATEADSSSSLQVAKSAIEKWSKELHQGNVEAVRWEMQQLLAKLIT